MEYRDTIVHRPLPYEESADIYIYRIHWEEKQEN